MKPLYLLDTNIVRYILKGSPLEILSRIQSKPAKSLAISAITAAELRYWMAKRPTASRIRGHIEDFLLRVATLPWDAEAAALHGDLKATLLKVGRPLSELDMLIAAHALALGAILVTHDAAFRQVPELQIEDWAISD